MTIRLRIRLFRLRRARAASGRLQVQHRADPYLRMTGCEALFLHVPRGTTILSFWLIGPRQPALKDHHRGDLVDCRFSLRPAKRGLLEPLPGLEAGKPFVEEFNPQPQ